MDNVKFNDRNAVLIFQDDFSLTFIKPLSPHYDDQLIVIHEDAYGDAVSGLIHVKTIKDNYRLSSETISEILKKLNQ